MNSTLPGAATIVEVQHGLLMSFSSVGVEGTSRPSHIGQGPFIIAGMEHVAMTTGIPTLNRKNKPASVTAKIL
jgi:hypothetical protein